MSPILVRPIREQFEHDRVIRQLQTRWRRKFDVAVNVGAEEATAVRVGPLMLFPDLVLTNTRGGRRLHGVVEVETAASVNHLEAQAEWAHFGKARGAFYLYVPAGFADVAERLCESRGVNVSEIWAYYAIGSQVKFSLAYRSPRFKSQLESLRSEAEPKAGRASARAAATATAKKTGAKKAEKKRGGEASARATRSRQTAGAVATGASKSARAKAARSAGSAASGRSGTSTRAKGSPASRTSARRGTPTRAQSRAASTKKAAGMSAAKAATARGGASKTKARPARLAARKK